MGLDLRMNVSMFLSIFTASVLFLVVFHVLYLGLWYLGLVSRVAKKRPEILTIIQNCTVLPLLQISSLKYSALLMLVHGV
jgi:hypothetical protein